MQNLKRSALLTIAFSIFLLTRSPCAFAHQVNVFAYTQGDTVYTESYFSDGKKVKGGVIKVYDSQGNQVSQGITDAQGQFNFKPAKKELLRIIINASMGHRGSYVLSANEWPNSNQEADPLRAQKVSKKITHPQVLGGIGYIFGIAGVALYFLSKKSQIHKR